MARWIVLARFAEISSVRDVIVCAWRTVQLAVTNGHSQPLVTGGCHMQCHRVMMQVNEWFQRPGKVRADAYLACVTRGRVNFEGPT